MKPKHRVEKRAVQQGMTYLQEASLDARERSLLASASLQLHVSHLLTTALEQSGVSRSKLAARMDLTPARIGQVFDGEPQNFTLDLIGRAAGALGLAWRVGLVDYWTHEDKFVLETSPVERPLVLLKGGFEQVAEDRIEVQRHMSFMEDSRPPEKSMTAWRLVPQEPEQVGPTSLSVRTNGGPLG